MKAIDIAIKDLKRSFRSASALVFMFGIPLLVTGMFYLMFGNVAASEGFELARIQVVVVNLDHGGPRLRVGRDSLPEGIQADTMGELVAAVLAGEDLAHLLEVFSAPDAATARLAVDNQQAQAAVIIPEDFSKQFADPDGQATLELYQDPTLTIGPQIVRAVLSRFIDSMAGVKIAVDQATEAAETHPENPALAGQVITGYLASTRTQTGDPADEFLTTRLPAGQTAESNPLLAIVTPIMGGMMIFYAYFTGASTAQSILREDEERTLPRLFTTPTPRGVILTGKFLAVFATVLVQVITLIVVSRLIFGIEWGAPATVALAAAGVVLSAATFGIFINSLMKGTRQSGMLFGGVLTVTGMLGMIRIFALNSPSAAQLGDTVGLLVPQGWAVRGLLEALNGNSPAQALPTLLALLAWSAAFFTVGVWRFRKRYG